MRYRHASSIAVAFLAFSAFASTPNTPEQEVARIAKHLKPIPDDEWKQIAGEHLTQKFKVTKGDTLFDISKTLFGDGKYWPKLWAINGQEITNPHVIMPGYTVSFIPGTGSSLPSMSVETAENDTSATNSNTATDATQDGHPPRSQEWKSFPTQDWENVQFQIPPEVDPLGFDSRSRVRAHGPIGFELPIIGLSEKIKPLGRIFAGENEGEFITLDELVFVHPEGELQIGQTYSVTEDPEKLENEVTTRSGYAYPLEGSIKILEQREGAYVGIAGHISHPFERGAVLIPFVPKVPEMTPIPGPSQMEGVVLLNRQTMTGTTAQHAFVFIDRGSNDGVAPGMVFRSYERIDPNNEKRITKANILINADIMVVHTSQKFCTGLVLSSYNYITEGAPVVLLTDVSDLLKKRGPNQTRLETSGATPTDMLDSLDNGNGLQDSEKRELKQLEKWKQNPTAAPSPAPSPESSEVPVPTPSEEVPPPPADEAIPPTAPEPGAEALPPPPSEVPPVPSEVPPPPSEVPPPPSEVPAPPANEPATEGLPPPSDQAAPPSNEIAPPSTDVPPPPPPDFIPQGP